MFCIDMKIQSIKYTPNISYKITPKKAEEKKPTLGFTSLPKINIPSFVATQLKSEEDFFIDFTARNGKVSKEEYDEIIKKHPSTITKAQTLLEKEKLTQSSPREVAHAAIKLKEKYDKEYEGNYIIASIGTSPAPICEVMSALGCNVKFIPASGLNRICINKNYIFRNQYPTTASRIPNVQHIINYAKKSGVKPNGKEHLILLDYCHTGESLEALYNIFTESKVYKPERMHDRSILQDLVDVSHLKVPNSDYRLEEQANISHDMCYSNFAYVSSVPHFYVYDEENQLSRRSVSSYGKIEREIFREFEEYSTPFSRAFALCAIHEAMKLQNNIS